MIGLLPRGVAEAILLVFVLLIGYVIVRSVRRRHEFAPITPDAGVELPTLTTEQRITGRVRRVWRDPEQGVWLVEIVLGKRRFTFCATDYATRSAEYQALVGKQADFALYALAMLAPGGVEAMKDQIKDFDKVEITPEMVRLIPTGQFANDHVIIGRILSHREEEMDGMSLRIYRTQVIRNEELTVVLELAVENSTSPVLKNQSMAHGSARLYGYLATS
jgi:hypothetical protein